MASSVEGFSVVVLLRLLLSAFFFDTSSLSSNLELTTMEETAENKSTKKNRKSKERKKAKKRMESLLDLQDQPLPLSIPPELFCYLISFLSTAETSIAMAISKTWRIKIKMDPSLHQELDLTVIKPVYPWAHSFKILPIFHRLSSLAENRLVKVSINLHHLILQTEQGVDYKVGFEKFFNDREFLSKSKDSLKEFCLQLPDKELLIPALSFNTMVHSLSRYLNSYPNLLKIHVRAHSTFIIKLQKQGRSRGKIFELSDISGRRVSTVITRAESIRYIQDLRILELVTWGNDFVGNKSLADVQLLLDEEEVLSSLILDTLSVSRLDLKSLVLSKGIQFKPSDVWKLVIQCPNLESLHIRFNLIPEDGEDGLPSVPVELKIPKEIKPLSKLKSFYLKCEDHWINWESMAGWMGSGLEELTIHEALGFYSREKSLFPSPKHLFLMTRVCFLNLRSIHLIGVHSKVPYSPQPEEKVSDSFPNLESITLDKVDEWTYSFFKNFSYPKLTTIWIQDGGSRLTEDPYYNHDDWTYREPEDASLQRSFDFLQFVLSACDTSILRSIYFSHREEMDLKDLDAIHVRLVFPKLEWIKLNGRDAAIEGVGRFIWKTSPEFPALIFVGSSSHGLWERFALKSPLLTL